MRRVALLFAFASLFALLHVWAPQAASFDCGEVSKPDEIAICQNPQLSALDSQMGGLWYAYSKVPMLMGSSGARHDEAEAFLGKRAACGSDAKCLADAYGERIEALESQLEVSMDFYFQLMNSDASEVPDDVGSIISGYADQCKTLGGSLTAGADTPRTMTADLDGDGEQDYVLNTQNLQCDAAATAYCGNGGCQIDIALSSASFENPVSTLGGHPMLVQAETGTSLEIWVDGTNCDLPGGSDQACWASYAWANDALTPSYQSRPVPD